MNLLDWLIVVLVLLSALHGVRVGAAVQLLSFAGALLGLVVGVAVVSVVSPHIQATFARTFVSLLLLILPCGLLGGAGRQLGAKVWGRFQGRGMAKLDAGAGAAIAMVGTLMFVWILASVMVSSPVASISNEIENSAILENLSNLMPPIPSELVSIEKLLNRDNIFPIVLNSGTIAPVRLPGSALVRQAVARIGNSTVQVTAFGCDHGDLVEKGSGIVVAPGLVVTNAHVVAGSNHVVVTDAAGYHNAYPVLFDPRYDLSVLRVANLTDRAIRLDPSYVGRGTEAAVLGFPGGRPFLNAQPAGVRGLLDATGYDIYGNVLTTREMYEIESLVRPGNSGGPLVEADGVVIGIVFSRQSSNDHIGYALASPGVLKRVREAERRPVGSRSGTGTCLGS